MSRLPSVSIIRTGAQFEVLQITHGKPQIPEVTRFLRPVSLHSSKLTRCSAAGSGSSSGAAGRWSDCFPSISKLGRTRGPPPTHVTFVFEYIYCVALLSDARKCLLMPILAKSCEQQTIQANHFQM